MLAGMFASRASAPTGSSYWNPSDKSANVTLSDSDRVATVTPASWSAVRGVTSHDSGKWYAEQVYVAGVSSRVTMGVGTSAMSLSNFAGAGTTSWALQAGGTSGSTARLLNNGSSLGAVAELSIGSHVRIAIDFDAGEGWIGSAAAWVLGGDPAAGTAPSFTFTPGTTLYLACGLNGGSPAAQCRLRTAAGDMSSSIPSGFSPWG